MALKDRVQNIILKPSQEWDVIAGETTPTPDLIKNYALPLVAIGVIAGFIGSTLIGSFRFATGLAVAIAAGVMALVGVYVLGLIINALAPKFGGEKNSAQALKLAVYSATPGWIAGVLNILPALGVLASLAGLYGLYLLYLGLPRLMKNPADKSVPYTVVVVLCAIGIAIVINMVIGAVIGGAVVGAAVSTGLR
jgi:hypothetical protein